MRKNGTKTVNHKLWALGKVALVALAIWATPLMQAKTARDEATVYIGNPTNFSNAAVIDARAVRDRIPAYQEIRDQAIVEKDPRYWPLARKGNEIFVAALRKVCKERGHDLVAESGSLSSEERSAPNITREVIRTIDKQRADDVARADKK